MTEDNGNGENEICRDTYYSDGDEEYSYTGYSAETEAHVKRRDSFATLTGDEEEFSYRATSDEEEVAASAATPSYGDFLVEEFSTETNIKKVTKFTHLSVNTVKYIFAAIYMAVGVVCVVLTKYMVAAVPYIVGAFMALIGLVQFVYAIKTKEYVHTESNKTATSLIMIALSIMILVEYEWALTFIAIVWGLMGLFEGAHAFNHAFSRIARGMRCSYYMVKGIIEVVLAFLLLYDPSHHINLHIIVFGVQLMFDSITMLPILKQKLSRRG